MKKLTTILLIILILGVCDAQAQKRRKVVKKKQPEPEVIEETPQEKLFKSMVGNTAKVMFIDSLVVDRHDFLSHIPLSAEAGMMIAYNELFDKSGQDSSFVFANEFGTSCYYSEAENDSTRHLYTIDKLGKTWSVPRRLAELDGGLQMLNYPFLMTDGVTLFFAAKGEESLGGYDIFMTRYDAERARFYNPENYGLPFNSPANEYFMAIDDYNQLGYLVSDRYQPEGKVCIYFFEPTKSRNSFEADNITQEQLNSFATLSRIKDTWKFGNRTEAKKRLTAAFSGNKKETHAEQIRFVVNDEIVYHSLNDFKSPESKELFKKYLEQKNRQAKDEITLGQLRSNYREQPISQRQAMRTKIIQLEKSIRHTQQDLNIIAKRIRKIELKNKP